MNNELYIQIDFFLFLIQKVKGPPLYDGDKSYRYVKIISLMQQMEKNHSNKQKKMQQMQIKYNIKILNKDKPQCSK